MLRGKGATQYDCHMFGGPLDGQVLQRDVIGKILWADAEQKHGYDLIRVFGSTVPEECRDVLYRYRGEST